MKSKIVLPFVVLSLLALAGCAALQESDNQQKEKALAAAGFQARPVDTDKRRAIMATLTPYKLQSRVHKGQMVYVYPDPSQNIVYVGGPAEYSAYQKTALKQEMVTQQQMSDMEYDAWSSQIMGGGVVFGVSDPRLR